MNSNSIRELKPTLVWHYFADLCQIPRPSKHEEKVMAYIEKFAQDQGLDYKKDDVGNILILKSAYPGMENRQTVTLQAHVDMVPQKDAESTHDFLKDPIEPIIEDGWVHANRTTLGADNGMGAAAALAILSSNEIKHGPIEALFTVDEEAGMTGATALLSDWLKGEILLNMDTEDEGEFYIGCAGGQNTDIELPIVKQSIPTDEKALSIKIAGLLGGHSGVDINLGRANAIKVLVELLNGFKLSFHLVSLNGGTVQRNAIPRAAEAVITVAEKDIDAMKKSIEKAAEEFKSQFKAIDPNFSILVANATASEILDEVSQDKLLSTLERMPNGVIAMSESIPELVQTSTNLAYVKTDADKVEIYSSQRSSVEEEKHEICDEIKVLFEKVGGIVKQYAGYPGWDPNPNSKIVAVAKETYQKLFNKVPEVKAIHAGLECGLIGSKYPQLDMISFGPTIKQAHSPNERVDIATVEKFWQFTLALLQAIPTM